MVGVRLGSRMRFTWFRLRLPSCGFPPDPSATSKRQSCPLNAMLNCNFHVDFGAGDKYKQKSWEEETSCETCNGQGEMLLRAPASALVADLTLVLTIVCWCLQGIRNQGFLGGANGFRPSIVCLFFPGLGKWTLLGLPVATIQPTQKLACCLRKCGLCPPGAEEKEKTAAMSALVFSSAELVPFFVFVSFLGPPFVFH